MAPKKKQKKSPVEIPSSPILPGLLSVESEALLKASHDKSGPYKHLHIDHICMEDRMRLIHHEIKNNLTATFKESDLFKVFQTGDLGNLSDDDKTMRVMPHLLSLRKSLYSAEFRQFIQGVTGCDALTDRIDLSINAYTNGCHLLCHDDVIGTRRISYIIYLTDPDEEWTKQDGGALELFRVDAASVIPRSDEEGGVQGVPEACPCFSLLPTFNSMAAFVVQPGRSYHSVQEVFTDKPRLSIR